MGDEEREVRDDDDLDDDVDGEEDADELDDGELDDDDGDDDGDDDETDLSEGAATPEAPWAPLPTWLARAYQQANPDAALDLIFPAVYEEDRSVLLKDLITSQDAQYITHRRAAEQAAKELGVENYDYAEEQDNIRAERKAGVGAPPLGAGDDLAKTLGLGGPPAVPSAPAPGPPQSRRRDEPAEPKRADLAAPAVRAFKRDMRMAEAEAFQLLSMELSRLREVLTARAVDGDAAASKEVHAALTQLSEALAQVVERVGQPATITVHPAAVTVQPPAITVEGATVTVPPQPAPVVNVEVVPSPAPDVHVEVHPPEPRPVRFERDSKTGAIIRSVPEEPA